MTVLDDLPWTHDDRPTLTGAEGRKCRRHEWTGVTVLNLNGGSLLSEQSHCRRCGAVRDEARARRGRNNRSRGNRAELAVARRYGGEKTGPLGQPEDIRGRDFRTQVKTHQGLPPERWRKVFAALDTQHDGRLPRLIERYLPGQGIAADDYIVVRGADWLAWFGRDE